MAIGVLKNTSKCSVKAEVTEGTVITAVEGDFIQILDMSIEPAKELLERQIIATGKGKVLPRIGIESASGTINVELSGGAVEGAYPQYEPVLHSVLGGKRQQASRITTDAVTQTVSLLTAAAHGILVGDGFVILDTNDHTRHFATAVTSNTITYSPVRLTEPADSVEISKNSTFFAEGTADEPTFSHTAWWGDVIKEVAAGCRGSGMSLSNFTTGQIPSLEFSYEALTFDETVAASGITPAFSETALPPLALSAVLVKDGVEKKMHVLSMSVENSLSPLMSVTESTGRISTRNSERAVSLELSPYLEDDDIEWFTDFDAATTFKLIVWAGNDSSTAGELDLGSQVGFYCPSCLITGIGKADEDGVITRSITVSANTGDGTLKELYMSFV